MNDLKTWIGVAVVLIAAACPASAVFDKDGDGMSDIWEGKYYLSTSDNGSGDSDEGPDADPDGDGWTNFQESVAGTDPFSGEPPEGMLQTHVAQNPAVPGVFVVSWPTLAGKQYTLLVSTDLSANSWTHVGDPIIGDETTVEIAIDTSNSTPPPPELFWRVSVVDIDSDGDGLSDYDEGLIGTDPYNPDTDGDKFSDSGEMDQGKSPTDSNDFPNVDWFVLEGNKAPGEAKTDTRTYTIIKGQSRVIVVGTTSEEYPYFTSYESPYNDTLAWEVTPSAGVAITGDIDVNERNDDWDVDLIAGVELNGFSPVHIERVKVIQATTEDVTITVKLTATNISDGLLPSTIIVGLLPVSIEPDDGMIGVVGDKISSNQGESGQRHFVTPKKTTEISNDFVNLKVEGLDDEAWITAEDPNQLVEWVPSTGQEAGADVTKWKVTRATADKYPVKIRTIAKYSNEEAAKLNVWVVWVAGSALSIPPLTVTETAAVTQIKGDFDYTWSIEPVEITSEIDIPDLTGANGVPPPNPEKLHIATNEPLSSGADSKWDCSRQVRVKILNPSLFTKIQLPATDGALYDNQPLATEVREDYPSGPVLEGNDDSSTAEESNDPYIEDALGKLGASDTPGLPMLGTTGVNGDTFEQRNHFKEFVRLEIANKWYRVADPVAWKVHIKFKKQSNSGTLMWMNDGSDQAMDNAGF